MRSWRRLGQHRSTIFHELRRNHFHDSEIPKRGYQCIVAQGHSDGRRTRRRKLVQDATPCKCLGFRTPAEVFKANLLRRGHKREKLSGQPKSYLSQRVQTSAEEAESWSVAEAAIFGASSILEQMARFIDQEPGNLLPTELPVNVGFSSIRQSS